nr:unnamed protein product [Digitaria exilis]
MDGRFGTLWQLARSCPWVQRTTLHRACLDNLAMAEAYSEIVGSGDCRRSEEVPADGVVTHLAQGEEHDS